MVDIAVREFLDGKRIRRLTHFTNSLNILEIIRRGAIESTTQLQESGSSFERTDPTRADNHPHLISMNIEYPNTSYFNYAVARENVTNYNDWAILLVDPQVTSRDGVLFSPVNAARGSGRYLLPGIAGVMRLYDDPNILGWPRGYRHNKSSPTDSQAEVMVPGPIQLEFISAIVVRSKDQLLREIARLELVHADPGQFSWAVSPGLFDWDRVKPAIRNSAGIPVEPYEGE